MAGIAKTSEEKFAPRLRPEKFPCNCGGESGENFQPELKNSQDHALRKCVPSIDESRFRNFRTGDPVERIEVSSTHARPHPPTSKPKAFQPLAGGLAPAIPPGNGPNTNGILKGCQRADCARRARREGCDPVGIAWNFGRPRGYRRSAPQPPANG